MLGTIEMQKFIVAVLCTISVSQPIYAPLNKANENMEGLGLVNKTGAIIDPISAF